MRSHQTAARPLLLVLLLISFSVLAENSTTIPGYIIHHNAIPTASLDPAVANQYESSGVSTAAC